MIINMLVLGFFLGPILKEHFPNQELLEVAGGLIIYYFISDILTRYFIQKFPSFAIKPYKTLPIKKSAIAHNFLLRSLGSFFNILPLFFLVPFFFREILPNYPATTAFGFALFSIGMILFNNFLAFGIDKAMALNRNWVGLILVAIIAALFLEAKGYIAIFPHLKQFAVSIIQNPLLSAIPVALASILYIGLQRFLTNNLNLEEANADRKFYGSSMPIGWFTRFGQAGTLMDLELKLMLRSKRARAYVIFSFLFLLYPLTMYEQGVANSPYLLIVFGLLQTGMIALNHGQLLLSWNSLHFDLLQSRGHTFYDIFSAKYYILTIACIITYLLCLPYFFLDPNIILFNTVLLFFNISISLFAYMLLASYNSLRIDPNEGGAFSFSGFGAAHYLIGIPIVGLPCLLYWVGALFGGKIGGVLLISLISIIGVLFHKSFIQLCVDNFKRNRYDISAAFRKSQ